MARKKKVNLEPEIEEKLKYIGLSLDNISPNLQEEQPLNYRVPRDYDENQYKQYRYIPVSKISILLTPTNRLDELEEKYRKATPLIAFLDNQSEESSIRHSIFLNMLKQLSLEDLEKLEKEQQKLSKNVPFRVKYENNYLWQIYYAENTDRYFMLVPTGDTNYTAFFYLLKKKLENKSKSFIYAPISGVDYSRKYFKKSEFKDIGNYLELFAKEWPYIYEVYNKQEEPSIYIVGETYIYGKIKSVYKVILENQVEANHFYKLLKAMFILQTELPNYFTFTTDIDQNGILQFYCDERKIRYNDMANFIKSQYAVSESLKDDTIEKIDQYKRRLADLKQIAAVQEIEYLEKEKQISTFLECKKTFFGKFKYFFKYNKKNKKKNEESSINYKDDLNDDNRSIFEFWKYSNKDEISVLPEGEEEEVGIVKKIEKVFDYSEDFEQFAKDLDRMQRKVLTSEEMDGIYISTTRTLPLLNKLITNTVIPKDIETELKELKKELKEEESGLTEEFDIFDNIIEEDSKTKKIGNQKYRETSRNKFEILEINKMTKQLGFKITLEKIIQIIKDGFESVKAPEDAIIYKAINDEKIDENEFNTFNLNPQEEIIEACNKEGKEINLYKINLKKGDSVIGFTNIIYCNNKNKTLPVGMDFSNKVMIELTKFEKKFKKSDTFHIAKFEDENNDFSKLIIKDVIVYEEK